MSTTQTRKIVASEARAALARDGRSADQLAADTGISKSSLSRKLRGLVAFSVDEVVAISIALKIDPGQLLPAEPPSNGEAAA